MKLSCAVWRAGKAQWKRENPDVLRGEQAAKRAADAEKDALKVLRKVQVALDGKVGGRPLLGL